MKLKVIIFISIFFIFYLLINYYIGFKVFTGISLKYTLNSKVFWIFFWFISLAYIMSRLLISYLPGAILSVFTLIGVYWLAILFYLLLIFPFIDLVRAINKKLNFIPSKYLIPNNLSVALVFIISLMIFFIIIYGTWNGRNAYVKNYEITINKDSLKIKDLNVIMVSDIHLGDLIENNRLNKMVEQINSLKPDVVFIAGDVVDNELQPFIEGKMAQQFSNIKSNYGVYASLGNHDFMGENQDRITEELRNAGVTVLRDEAIVVDSGFIVAGRDDISINRIGIGRKDLDEILRNYNKSMPLFVLDHNPSSIKESEEAGIDLQFSGHTHKGQFFPNNLITKGIFEVDYGYLKKGDFNVIVSSGYGTWGPPIRIGSRSEIVNLKIKFQNNNQLTEHN
ncbi:phosphohydrolase [Clostridium polyendosporum]|uniref:Phosphohydrolase n=1 Tax=Clostridium polyendosporum TaxID=69208 RepID=A0A919RZD9_9CLOT|nr:metallophosphoesterase [Clostridium polyendosporum]GIM28300.1 phosphohydrolase [Clostridium polyendosporum]